MKSSERRLACLCAFVVVCLGLAPVIVVAQGCRVTFNSEGIVLVDSKPFFPIGMFTYELNPEVLAELHELQCNTIVHGFAFEQLNLIHQHGLMAICSPDWFDKAAKHPAVLSWYLTDEPENRGVTPDGERKRYLDLKAADPNHP